jgi:hypothetical protein
MFNLTDLPDLPDFKERYIWIVYACFVGSWIVAFLLGRLHLYIV